MSRSWFPNVAAALVGAVAFAGSARWLDPALRPSGAALPGDEVAGIRRSLEEFNRIYEDLYATGGGPALIDEFPATRAVKHHVFRDVGFLRDAGYVQVQDLATANIREIRSLGRGNAEAIVYEEWNYMLQRSTDRAPATPVKGAGQGFRYRLTKQGGRWVVTSWELEELQAPPSRGFTW